jgi:hypothetical protein
VLQRYRGWILIAGLVAIAVIGTVIALRFGGTPKLDSGGMASYMPERDAAVLYIDVASLRSSGILEKLVGSTVGEEAEYRTFVEQSGFDYKRDLDRVMTNSADGTHYFLLDGRFDWTKLKDYAKGQGGSCEGDFCFVRGTTPGRIVSFYPISGNLMALASSSHDKAAREINRRTPVKPTYVVPAQPLWLHIPASTLHRQSTLPAGTKLFTRALESAERVMFSLGLQADKFELTMDVTCRTTESAAVMKSQLEGITQLLQSLIAREKQKPSASDLSGVLSSGSFQRQSEHVIGRWSITKAFVESLGGS